MFNRILTSALPAGAAAGLIAGLLQLQFVQPILLQAELYESGQLVHFGSGSSIPATQELGGIAAVRNGLSVLFTMLIYTGYTLILVVGMALAETRGARITARTGLLWGIAGFVAFQFAPGFTLAPEVPGVASGDLAARQIWWFATVAATAAGLWLIAFGQSWLAWGPAILLLLAPHLAGAPQPEVFTGPVPTELGALFAARAFGVGMAAWGMAGGFAGYLWSREDHSAVCAESV